ncbi:ricin B lectin domain-containing protein [Crepidotus variabilis]|uniref:Ricin B lectin domain-containing protein n=1 Tax=Crepidotus variabilis TaxID=179855 RepID=A0A9P6JQ26_9AGAR|nr:ricin B lectin domain-containing protein [Crepidotus variabilis]
MVPNSFSRANLSLKYSVLALLFSAAYGRQYTVVNECPSNIDLYIGGNWDSTLNPGSSVTRYLGVDAGFFYTTTNGGSTNGHSTRAGFYGDGNTYDYYMVKDWDSFNTGMKIAPNHPESNGFCPTVTCDAVTCSTAFDEPPTHISQGSAVPPNPPIYSCPFPDVAYTISFCPFGSFPGDYGRAAPIHPNYNPSKCMDVRGAVYADGTPVQIYDCNGTGAQKWVSNEDFTKVRVAGTNYCLDAGTNTANGVGMKIWTCYDNLGAQEWFASSNKQIIREGTGFCLDLPNGNPANGNQLQTWECANGNTNQVWTKNS